MIGLKNRFTPRATPNRIIRPQNHFSRNALSSFAMVFFPMHPYLSVYGPSYHSEFSAARDPALDALLPMYYNQSRYDAGWECDSRVDNQVDGLRHHAQVRDSSLNERATDAHAEEAGKDEEYLSAHELARKRAERTLRWLKLVILVQFVVLGVWMYSGWAMPMPRMDANGQALGCAAK
ncbi:hypothetical protein HMN09_00669700 [Mycena chlorophos]|uniref:Uncharacterized protein n=1 Tax=Mycena chlorophos TaxID=658473 RepID=A0A8H6SYA2_MYCCL|nr:hypothetical protein HMN09_00669700 [Mycena chlorophos]